ncbi:MAG: site-specific integrase, partial [Planctomycetota bacterium]
MSKKKPLTKLQQHAARGSSSAPRVTAGVTHWFESYQGYLRSECHLSENTVAAYGRDMQHFDQWLTGRSIPSLKISELSDYVAWLAKLKLAPASIARHIVALRMFFKYLQ